MIRFERDIYISLLAEHIEKENEKVRQQNAKSQMSIVVGAGAAWFGLYTGSSKKFDKK